MILQSYTNTFNTDLSHLKIRNTLDCWKPKSVIQRDKTAGFDFPVNRLDSRFIH